VAIQIGDLIEAQHYNDLALEINRLFSDNTVNLSYELSDLILDTTNLSAEAAGYQEQLSPTPLSTDFVVVTVSNITLDPSEYSINYGNGIITYLIPLDAGSFLKAYNRTAHRFGWGQQASVYPISAGEIVRADEETLQAYIQANTNNLIDKVNIIEDRISGPTELTRFNQGKIVEAQDKLAIQSAIDDDVLPGNNYWQNDIATIQGNIDSFTRAEDWDNILVGVFRYSWPNYEAMRYFFNSGCHLRQRLEMTGDEENQGYFNWNQVVNDMGSLIIDYDTTSQSGVNGTSSGFGAYELTSSYQTVFISGSPRAPKDDGGLYDEYNSYDALRLVWTARILEDVPIAGWVSIDIRVVMDDMDLNTTTSGTTTMYSGYKLADDVTDNSAVFSVTGFAPNVSPINTFNSTGNLVITNITNANPGVVTVSDTSSMINSSTVTIDGVVGMTSVNGQSYTITILNSTTFEIAVDTTSFGAYVSDGTVVFPTEDN